MPEDNINNNDENDEKPDNGNSNDPSSDKPKNNSDLYPDSLEEKAPPEEPEKKKRRFGLFYKLMGGTIALLVLLPVSLYFLSMNDGFRQWAIGKIVEFVNDSLEGEIEVGDIDFFDKDGIRFSDVVVHAAGDTLASIPDMLVDVKARDILDNKVLANRIEINNARIKIIRDMDSVWNFSRIAAPSAPDTSTKQPTYWQIAAENLEFNNSYFLFRDSIALHDSTGTNNIKEFYPTMNYQDFILDKMNLRASDIEVLTEHQDYSVNILNLSFDEDKSPAKIDKLDGELKLNQNGIFAEDLGITIDEAEIDLEATATGFNPFAGDDIRTADWNVELGASKVDGYEIESFAPMPIKLDRTADITLSADGTFKELNIQSLELEFASSQIDITGILQNITEPDQFFYDLEINNSNIQRRDIAFINGLDLSSLPQWGNAKITILSAEGTRDYAKANVEINTSLGYVRGNLSSDWSGKISYSFDGRVKNINLEKITGSPSLDSDLSGKLQAKGRGTDLSSISADINFSGGYNRFNEYAFDQVLIDADLDNGFANINKVELIKFNSGTDEFLTENETLVLKGDIDLSNMESPVYNFNIDADAINLKQLLGTDAAPNYLTGDLVISGSGFDLSDINGMVSADVDLVIFEDRALLPFGLDFQFENTGDGKLLSLESDFMDFYIEGVFEYGALVQTIQVHATELAGYAEEQANKIITSTQKIAGEIEEDDYTYLERFPPLDAKIFGEITDLSPISIFIDSTNILSTININMNLYNQDSLSVLEIDSISIDEFSLIRNGLNVATKDLEMSGKLQMDLVNNDPVFSKFNLNMDAKEPILVNENTFYRTYLYSRFDNDTLGLSTHVNMNQQFDLSLVGDLYVYDKLLDMDLTVLEIGYDSTHIWKNINDIQASFGNEGFFIDSLRLQRDDKEIISLNGSYDSSRDLFENVNLTVTGFDFKYIDELMPSLDNSYIDYANGKVDTLGINLTGSMSDPDIDLLFSTKDLVFNRINLGNIYAKINHDNDVISGLIASQRSDSSTVDDYRIDINSIPFSLRLESMEDRWNNKENIDVDLDIDSLSLAIADPFLDFMSNSKGYINVDARIEGTDLDNLDLSGGLKYDNISTRITPINMFFRSTGDIEFNNDAIVFKQLNFSNPSAELSGSKADVSGKISLNDFVPDEFDMKIDVDRLKVLSARSEEVMPDIYGDLVISTGREGIDIKGNIDSPRISGDIEILRSDLTLPLEDRASAAEAKFDYYWEGENIYMVMINEEGEEEEITPRNSSFYEAMGMDFKVYFPSNLVVNIDINALMSVEAHIGTRLRGTSINFQKIPFSDETKLIGDIFLQEDSRLNFAGRDFETSGSISFPDGDIENPLLDITAVYDGRISNSENTRDFTVTINVDGPKENPDITYNYTIGNQPDNQGQETRLEDVLSLIVLGALPNNPGGGGGESSLGAELGESATSTLLNPALKSFLGEVAGTLSFLDLDVQTRGGVENTTVRLRGKVIDGIYISGGGGLYGQEITIEVPLAELLKKDSFDNFRLQFTQFINNNQNATVREQINSEFKLRWAKTW